VLDAIGNDRPVVALESTIISHGMPYPRNKQVVLDTEKLIRSMGVIPAVCAIINGPSSLTDIIDCSQLF
jgi:pseudouridylate synthase